MLDSLFDLSGRLAEGVAEVRARGEAPRLRAREKEWAAFNQQQEAASQRQAQEVRQQQLQELELYPAQATAIGKARDTAADNELQRTLTQQSATAGLAQNMMTRAADISGGLDTTRTNNDLRKFEPVKSLVEGQRVADREMANLFVGNDPGNPLSQQVIGSAERMQGNQYGLIRELAQMNQPSAFGRFIGDVTPLLALASALAIK